MARFVNAIEHPVVKEVRLQLEELSPFAKQQIKLVEVVAYSLNRLPTMYATSRQGYFNQHDRAITAFGSQIVEVVRRGFQIVQTGDPLHDVTPLPQKLLMNEAGTLYALRQIFRRRLLRWKDVPNAVRAAMVRGGKVSHFVEDAQDTVLQIAPVHVHKDVNSHPEKSYRPRSHQTTQDIKSYLQRANLKPSQKPKNLANEIPNSQESILDAVESDWVKEIREKDLSVMDAQELESYTLRAELGYTNVMENLVIMGIQKIAATADLGEVNFAEVAAYALNRLPPMYTTSERGFKLLSQKGLAEASREILSKVRNGILKVHEYGDRPLSPIHFDRFNQESEEAIMALRIILNRQDITIVNVVDIIKNLIS
ncbi:late competence development ComFB family protein [Tumidithrix elongata RA019]|uniref:Late competence development ComFB family protein n=1 Tax=Tumidithrix elongata BACA0141 TaxID=2716417 RepID=A0AAW9Q3I9_9CYAN|nr:late competence development ComFB family protein [Tumidithrix elongata RA019]